MTAVRESSTLDDLFLAVREIADAIGRALGATSFTYRLLHRLDMLAGGGRVVDLFNGRVQGLNCEMSAIPSPTLCERRF